VYLPYAGIGSRETPDDVLSLMAALAEALARRGWTLRSGGADGADTACEKGAMRGMDLDLLEPWPEIFLPWPNFNSRPDGPDQPYPQPEAYNVAAQFHPAWHRLSPNAKSLHARNAHQILGGDLRIPVLSLFVVCWTKHGAGGGGTGQALRMAKHYALPIYDLARSHNRERVETFLAA
jgi:hypothetical protein